MSETSNPFAALLSAKADSEVEAEEILLNTLIEKVFLFSINESSLGGANQLVYLEDLASAVRPKVRIDLESLEQGLFERLLMPTPVQYLAPAHRARPDPEVVETRVFPYLYHVLQNLDTFAGTKDDTIVCAGRRMRELVLRNSVTALKQPALFEGQNLGAQLLQLLTGDEQLARAFFLDIVAAFMVDDDGNDPSAQLREALTPLLLALQAEINKYTLINLPLNIVPVVQLFANNQHLALVLIEACEPANKTTLGRAYQESVLGGLLSLSPLPRSALSPSLYFDDPMDQSAVSLMESSLWNALKHLTESLHKIFLSLLKSGAASKHQTLAWFGSCLKANRPRGKLWNVQAGDVSPTSLSCVSDGFMLNLGTVLLRLCEPFCSKYDDPKSLKIDPTYCAVPPEQCEAKSVHLDFLHEATCLLPPREADDGSSLPRPVAPTYNFLTDCFFLAHECIDLGMRVCADKLVRLGQEIGPVQQAMAGIEDAAILQTMHERLRPQLTRYLSLWCALSEPQSASLLARLHATTGNWLVQLAVHADPPGGAEPATYAPLTQLPVQMPITVPLPDTLRCVPEFVLENIVVFVSVVRRTSPSMVPPLSDAELSALYTPTLTLVLTFMGDARVYNPHLRARLAECLEAMLPDSGGSTLSNFYREQLFKEHPHRNQLVRCLLEVFVSIEMTGQSVQFELKFNYRRPMYLVMDFLWGIEEHRECFTQLARDAEANMEAVQPPLFLRFVNLLMNDAIFLLDEALNYMAQIRTAQAQQDAGEWASQSADERSQNMSNLTQVGMRARFHNILGRDTVRALVRMTAHAPYVFCHPTLVDRIASMLNYFLLNLTGPNKKNFKVKDGKKYQFEPANTVLDICRMYVQLGSNERFCAAVSDDGRSYSPLLFEQADGVLVRIGGGGLITSLQEVAARVAALAARRRADEELLADAPEDFLDPIMSTLMLDPVLLPSSRTTVDRTTIARHLLSDQSDPFNRSPLTMNQVKSNTELKQRIDAWVAERRGQPPAPV